MASLESRLTALETQASAEDTNRVVLYEVGTEPVLPDLEGTVFLLPDNHRQEATHA